jgi:hypothetical protein
MASYNGGAQEFIASCEAEVEPAGFLLALLGNQQGTARKLPFRMSSGPKHLLGSGKDFSLGTAGHTTWQFRTRDVQLGKTTVYWK